MENKQEKCKKPGMSRLEDLKKQVHTKGFNISMMINRFKKEQRNKKSTAVVPDSVYEYVCLSFLSTSPKDKAWAYFMKVLVMKFKEHMANSNVKQHKKYKSEPTRLKITIG